MRCPFCKFMRRDVACIVCAHVRMVGRFSPVFILGSAVTYVGIVAADRELPVTKAIPSVAPAGGSKLLCVEGSYNIFVPSYYAKAANVLATRVLVDSTGRKFPLPTWGPYHNEIGWSHAITPMPYVFSSEVAPGDATITTHPEYWWNWITWMFPVPAPDRVMHFRIEPSCKEPT